MRKYIISCFRDLLGDSGRRPSIPSSIDNCARVSETEPVSTFGQMQRPRSSRLANRQNLWPSTHKCLGDGNAARLLVSGA